MLSLRSMFVSAVALALACCTPAEPPDDAAPADASPAANATPPGTPAAADTAGGTPADYRPNPATDKLRAPITVAKGLQVVVSDAPIPPNQSVDLHYHPGEEFVYVLEGSAVHSEPGQPDRVLRPGDAYVIPPSTPHAPRGGPEGGRAIVFRVQVDGQPDRVWLDDTP